MANEDQLNSEQAAEIARVTSRAIRLAAKEGRLKGRKFGRDWLFYRNDLEAWMQSDDYKPRRKNRIP